MHFPWKKVRSAKISQFVNDHLHHSQKRRDESSLVVETGFPTSLVDLFMKNREKLKKPSKKKRQSVPISAQIDANDSVVAGSRSACSSPLAPSSPMISSPVIAGSSAPSSPFRSVSPLRRSSVQLLSSRGGNENLVVESSDGGGTSVGRGAERGVDGNNVLMVVLKMFLVVVLALGSQRLTVGITISAFLLFFMEFVGKYVCGFLKPCSEGNGMLWSMVHAVWRLLRYKEVNLDETNGGVSMPELQQDHSLKPGSSSLKSNESRYPDQDIQIVEPEDCLVNRVDEIQPEDEITDSSCSKPILGYQEIEPREVAVVEKEEPIMVAESKRKSKRAKITSKMKKFVPKKMRISRKHNDDSQRPEIVREDTNLLSDILEVYESEDEGESDSARSSISSGNYIEEDSKRVISALCRLSNISEKATTESAEKGQEIGNGLTWTHLVLCQIVLVGLIGGRGYALVLTLSWCLLLKLSEALARCIKRVPIIRSFSEKSG